MKITAEKLRSGNVPPQVEREILSDVAVATEFISRRFREPTSGDFYTGLIS